MSLAERPHLKHWPRRLPRSLCIPETSLWFNLEVSARRYPSKAAYIYGGKVLSYAELHAQAEALAGWLRAQGVQRGDRVAIFLQNCPQFVVAFYAAMRADAVVVPVNPMNRADEFGHYIDDPDTRVVICAADLAGIVEAANAALPAERQLQRVLVTRYADALPDTIDADLALPPAMEQWLRADPPQPAGSARWLDALAHDPLAEPSTAGPDDLAMLPYTSGTTGLPKGCMHTHRTLMANAMGAPWSFASAEDDRPGRGADVPHHRDDVRRAGLGGHRQHAGHHAALGPRTGRTQPVALQGHALDLHPHDDHRPVRQPPTTRAST